MLLNCVLTSFFYNQKMKKMKKITLLLFLITSMLQAQFVPITNGTFNTTINGWSNTTSGVTAYNNGGQLTLSGNGNYAIKSPLFNSNANAAYRFTYNYQDCFFAMGGCNPIGFPDVKFYNPNGTLASYTIIDSNYTYQLSSGFLLIIFQTTGSYYAEFTGKHSNSNLYYIDNVGFEPAFVTKVQTSQCGTTLSLINDLVIANSFSGAQGYRFKVTNLATNQVQTIDKTFNSFRITDLPNFAYNSSYKIEIALKINNVWLTYYGLPCTVSTPIITKQITSSQCGATVSSFAQSIFANIIPYATGYQFKITNLTNPSPSQIVNKNLRAFSLSDFTSPTVAYDSNYSVEVAVKNTDGTYLPFGTLCTISTPTFPTTQLQTSQCNYTVANKYEVIYANAVASTTLYKFRLTNSTLGYSQSVDRILRTFTLSQFTGLQTSTTYNVEVSLKIGGVFGPFGSICTISTPAVLKNSPVESIEIASEKILVSAYPNPFNENFKLNLDTNNTTDVSIKIYDMMGIIIENRSIKLSEIETLELGNSYKTGIYNVIVNQAENSKIIRIIKR